jgi:hypothetical protein
MSQDNAPYDAHAPKRGDFGGGGGEWGGGDELQRALKGLDRSVSLAYVKARGAVLLPGQVFPKSLSYSEVI